MHATWSDKRKMKRIAGVDLMSGRFTIDRSTGTYLEDLFSIDSMILVLGKNGSGKTTLLHEIAEVVSLARKTKIQNVFIGSNDSISSAPPSYLRSCGVVYFSPLPYRRALPKRTRLSDASPDFKTTHNIDQIEQFHKVALDLEVESTLEAVIGYSQRFYREIVLPIMLNPNMRFIDYDLESLVRKFRKVSEDVRSSLETRDEFNSKNHDDLRSGITAELVRYLKYRVGQYFFNAKERIVHLASMQVLAKNKRCASAVAWHLLSQLRLVEPPSRINNAVLDELELLVKNTEFTVKSDNWKVSVTDPNVLILIIRSVYHARSLDPENPVISISWLKLSSGLRALVEKFTYLRKAFEDFRGAQCRNILLLIDEGDAYLHLEWQRKYVYMLDKFLLSIKKEFGFEQLQVVLATHSPLIAADFPLALVASLDANTNSIESFAAPVEEVIIGSFGTSAIGMFAEKKINEILERATRSKLTTSDIKLVDIIGDEGLRNAVKRAIGRKKNDN